MQYDFDGRSVIVTGGSGGMVRATSLAFASAGAKVLVVDVDDKGGDETVEQIRASGGKAGYLHTDVSSAIDVKAMVDRAGMKIGRAHV